MHGVVFHAEALLSLENAWLPQFSFWISKALAKFCKNIPVLVGTTHRKPEYLEMRRTHAYVAKVGTVLNVRSQITLAVISVTFVYTVEPG